MISNTYINFKFGKIVLSILVVLLILFALINFGTMRTAEVPTNPNDSKQNGTFISEYKLLDSTIGSNKGKFKINSVWSAFSIASFNNIFIRTDVEIFSPQFIITIENGSDFLTEYMGYKLFFPEFNNEKSGTKGHGIGGHGIGKDFFFTYELLESDTIKLKTQDTIKFYFLDPQDSLINTFTLIKII